MCIIKNILSQKREVIYESGNDWMYFWIFSNDRCNTIWHKSFPRQNSPQSHYLVALDDYWLN
ncbi:MAG: hypothetical protein A3I85_02705 [Candidatus Nealsonbacteria bacterium RIFCSPLOWO2_02_FULL_38_63]|nr:MAG: hypothetical protein A3I85_02705 [Candidatus Nealsonbacteria bacterium RIFCSPLOWO2_02_FULL_38_63]